MDAKNFQIDVFGAFDLPAKSSNLLEQYAAKVQNFSPEFNRLIEQYAYDVRSFSSQYGSEMSISYTAYNICGTPSKYPAYGDFPQTFVMRTYGKWWDEAPSRRIPIEMPHLTPRIKSQDYIDISFENKVIPFAVNIYETYHPGSVVRIWASDGKDKWSLLWEGEPQERNHTPIIFSPPINRINFYTNILRLEFDHSHLDYYTEIDAVSIIGIIETKQDKPLEVPESICEETESNSTLEEKSTVEVVDSKASLEEKSEFIENVNGFFSSLPDETALKIFSYLDLKSLCRCAQVNRYFNTLASDSLLYASLNLKPYWHVINASTLNALSLRCKHLQKLDLSWCGSFPSSISPQIFCKFIRSCGELLTHIRLDCCQFVCNCCLETISRVCKNLTELTLQNCVEVSERGFNHLASLKSIERLDFYKTLIEAPALKEILTSSPHLKHINLGSCRAISSMDEIAQTLGTYNKELVSIDFWKTYSLTPIGIKYLSQCNQLEEIDIGWCLGVSIPGDCFRSLAKGCPKLRKLFMGSLRGITDRDLYPFIFNCPNLEQIDLLGNRGITSEVCLNLLGSCKRLRFLDVSFCELIKDAEVNEWRKLYPNVDIKRSFQSEPECNCALPNHF